MRIFFEVAFIGILYAAMCGFCAYSLVIIIKSIDEKCKRGKHR